MGIRSHSSSNLRDLETIFAEKEIEKEIAYRKYLATNTNARNLDSHMSRLQRDLTGTHHELDGFVHTDPHDAFSMRDMMGQGRVREWLNRCDHNALFKYLCLVHKL
jgi:hypothetical protein